MSSDLIPRRLVLASLCALAGCGFAPVYGTGNGVRGQIAMVADDSVAGFYLQQRLKDRLGRAETPAYVLTTMVESRQRSAAVTSEGDTLRFNLIGTATWRLEVHGTEEVVDSGEVEAFTSYSASGSTVATQTTKDDAEKRLSILLADMIASRVLVLDLGPSQ